MATERVGIEIALMGYKEARDQMAQLDAQIRGLNGRKNYLRIKARVDELKMNKSALQAARVKVQADMTDVDRKLRASRKEAERLGKAMQQQSRAGGGRYDPSIARDFFRVRKEMSDLNAQKLNLKDQFKQINNEIGQTTSEMNRLNGALRNAGLAGKGFGDIFKGVSSRAGHIGQAMQSLGNALTRLTYPMRMFTSGALMGAGYAAMNKVTEGLKSGFSRYDIMKKYPKVMSAFGYSADEAQASIDKLDKSVRGLPTGLDEMVQMSQRFTATTGDLEKGTNLAIATNNAFLASMSTDTQRYQGMMQLQDVLGGKDMNAREWNSLVSSMTPAIVKMGESLGYTKDNMSEWIQKVRDGKVANDDFIDTLIKVGTENGEVAKLANESKDTWQAFSANVTNAFSRMAAGVITSLDDIVKVATGGKFDSLNLLLSDKVGPGIDKMAQAAKDWIKANPDKILDFVDALKSFDWKGLGKGLLTGFGDMAKAIKAIADKLGGGDMEKVGRFIAWLPALGSGLTIAGGMLKGTRHLWGVLSATFIGMGRAIMAIAGGAGIAITGGIIGKAIGALKGLSLFGAAASGSKMAKLYKGMKFLKKFGKLGKGLTPGAVFKFFLPAIEAIGAIGIMITEVGGTIALNTWLLKKSVDNILGITDGVNDIFTSVSKMNPDKVDTGSIRNAVNTLTDIYDILYGEQTEKRLATANKAGTGTTSRAKGISNMSPTKIAKSARALEQMFNVFTNMGKVLDTFKPLTAKMSETIGTQKGRGKTPFSQLREMLAGEDGLLSQFTTMMDDIDQSLGEAPSIETVPKTIQDLKDTFTNINDIMKLIPNLVKNLIPAVGRGTGGMGISKLDQIRKYLGGETGVFAQIRGIYDSINQYLLGTTEAGEERSNAIQGNTKNAAPKTDTQEVQKITSSKIEEMAGVMENVKNMFTHIGEFVSLLPDLQSQLAPMMQGNTPGAGTGSLFDGLKTHLTNMMSGLGEIVTTINTIPDTADLETKTKALSTAISNIKGVVAKLKSLGEGGLSGTDGAAFTAIDNIKAMVSRLADSLETMDMSTISIAASNLTSKIDEIFSVFQPKEVEVEVAIKGKVTGWKELLTAIRQANDAIARMVNSIRTNYTKEITINLHRNVNVTGTDPSTVDVGPGYARGGRIPSHKGQALYRAKGGDIFSSIFKPKGTDTVPAMLTPGEYVMRKKAVDTFGARFMQRINHMDVAGAFRELSARFGGIVTAGSNTYITNNITNNNAPTINQTVHTNNPNFAFKRSNRYVMAL